MQDILVIEPFYGGSHAQLIDVLLSDPEIGPRIKLYSMPAKKWHWRARTSALYFMQAVESSQHYRVLFCSSVLSLTELIALRPDLSSLKKIVYFHENQLVYPVRKIKDRDFHYGYSQITTSLVADHIIFNSQFNRDSFLNLISSHLKLIPDHRPKDLQPQIQAKCSMLYFPMNFDEEKSKKSNSDPIQIKEMIDETHASDDKQQLMSHSQGNNTLKHESLKSDIEACEPQYIAECDNCLHIVWPHRWEHDKDPETFFHTLFQLEDEGYNFRVSVLGETYGEVPDIFTTAKDRLGHKLIHWGFQSKQTYNSILEQAHVAVSTAIHEFFGVSMLEATSKGCFPLCPRRLVYPEFYPDECLYSTQTQLLKRLKKFCIRPDKIPSLKINLERFSWTRLRKDYQDLLLQPDGQ